MLTCCCSQFKADLNAGDIPGFFFQLHLPASVEAEPFVFAITPGNALMCYNLLYYLWKHKRASLCAGRLSCQPCRVVSSSLFLPIWLVLARLPFRRSRPIIILSRWHLCSWCAALRGSLINIRYTHAGAHTGALTHFPVNLKYFWCRVLSEWCDAGCNICTVIPERWEQPGKHCRGSFLCKENLAGRRRWVSFIYMACQRTSAAIWLRCTANNMTFEWLTVQVYQPWCWQPVKAGLCITGCSVQFTITNHLKMGQYYVQRWLWEFSTSGRCSLEKINFLIFFYYCFAKVKKI